MDISELEKKYMKDSNNQYRDIESIIDEDSVSNYSNQQEKQLFDEDFGNHHTFTKSSLKYKANDPKFTKMNDNTCKKMKISDSLLAAKARCSPNSFENTFSTDTTISGKLHYFDKEKTGPCRYICKHDGCGKKFFTRKDLRRHKLIHRVRKHVCPIEGCDRAFFEKSKLKRHMVVHTKKKEFSCPICGKKFGYKANVKTHMRTHTGERPFKCRVKGCNKNFAQASNRNAHEKTHFKTPEEREKLKENQAKARSTRKRKVSESSMEDVEEVSTVGIRRSSRIQNKTLDEKTAGIPISIFKGVLPDTNNSSSPSLSPRQLDFDELMNDVCKLSPIEPINDTKIIKEEPKNTLFNEPPPNFVFNSFTSFTSFLHDGQQHTDLGLNIDAIDNEFLGYCGHDKTNLDSRIEIAKALRTPSRLTSQENNITGYGFQDRSKLPDISTSFLSTSKFNLH